MKIWKDLLVLGALVLGWSLAAIGPVSAEEPAAMVEDVAGTISDVQPMDFLYAGDGIDLGTDGTLTIGYFVSCAQEVVTGGKLTVGRFESTVEGGKKQTTYIDCDDQAVELAAGQEQETGTSVFRPGEPCTGLTPDLVLYDPSPIVRTKKGAAAVSYIAACDATKGTWNTVPAQAGVADFRKAGVALDIGGTYLMRAGDRTVTVLVSKLAAANSSSLLSRFVPLN